MTQVREYTIAGTADFLLQSIARVDDWIRRYRENGIDALCDAPRSGRPTDVPEKKIQKVIKKWTRR